MSLHQHLYDPVESELVTLGARSDTSLISEIQTLVAYIENHPDVLLQDIAYTCARRSHLMPKIIALVVSSVPELHERLNLAKQRLAKKSGRVRDKAGTYFARKKLYPEGKIAFLFPGAMSFYPDMLRDLCVVFQECRKVFDELEGALQEDGTLPFSLCDYIFPPDQRHRSAFDKMLDNAFPESVVAAYAANTAMYRIMEHVGIKPDGMAGFTGGEFAALEAAGAYGKSLKFKRVQFIREGYQMLSRFIERDDIPGCAMLSVQDITKEKLHKVLDKFPGRAVVSFYHTPTMATVSLAPEILKQVSDLLGAAGAKVMTLPIGRPFNTPWCSKVLPSIRQFLSHWLRHTPRIPLYSCTTASLLPRRVREMITHVADQWTAPIIFEETIQRMYDDGFRIFIELGARGNMTNAIKDILKKMPHQAVALNRIHRSGMTQMNHALGTLISQGVPIDLTKLHQHRRCNALDFQQKSGSAPLVLPAVRLDPSLPLLDIVTPLSTLATSDHATPSHTKTPSQTNGSRKINFGVDLPMLNNAVVLKQKGSTMVELAKTITLTEFPFLKDYSLGTSKLSFVHPEMVGLTLLSLSSGLEIMCEAARQLFPRQRVIEVDNLRANRWVGFEKDELKIVVRAEAVSWSKPEYSAVKVQLRDDQPHSPFTMPILEAVVLLTAQPPERTAIIPPPLTSPYPVNWSGSDIYPGRLFHGTRLQLIKHVELWSEEGIDFEIEVPKRDNAVAHTKIPLFSIWPMLLDGVVSSFPLWRSHERFYGAISLPFRARSIRFHTSTFSESMRLRGYFRLKSVTPRSHVADIQISDGNGNLLLEIRGWEEICERVPRNYHTYILHPSECYLTQEMPMDLLGTPVNPASGSVATDMPYKIFENNQELWLKTLANVALSPEEREEWEEMQGVTSRKTQWLFGRAAAKEAVRRFLQRFYHSHWTSADIHIWADGSGKPHALGGWREHTRASVDISIAHTQNLVVAAAVANAHIGVDIESVGRDISEEFTRGVFTPDELELAAGTGEAPIAMLRFWCAKEAISKALGTGIRYSPQDLMIKGIDIISGQVQIELQGQWLDAFKQLKGRQNIINTSVYAAHVFASCLLPASLFKEDKLVKP